MEAYLDNSATTVCDDDVTKLVVKLMTSDYGNPSSMHKKGFEAEQYIRHAREQLAKIWKVSEKEVYFTSGGTESDNMAVIGAALAMKRRGMHLITTKIEHAAISACMKYLESIGFEIEYLSVDKNGIINLSKLKEKIRKDTTLVSVMHVNNEIGSIEPITEIGKLIKECNPDCLFHVDDIQGFGKLKLFPKKQNIDMISISGHKIHGPKGSGALYVSERVRLQPLIFGGGQQKGYRSGTENVPGIAGIGLAAEKINQSLDETTKNLYEQKAYFCTRMQELQDVSINGLQGEESAPHIVSVSVKGIRSEVLLHSLEEMEVYVSAGSACASNKPAVSATLQAIGLQKELLDSTIRFSFSIHTTKEELAYAADCMAEILPKLRKYTRH